MKTFFKTCLICVALLGCSNDESAPPLNKEAEASEPNDVNIVEKETPAPQEITLFVENREKHFLLKDLPLIQKYVQTSPQPDLEVAEMRLQELENPIEETSLYMLSYACGTKQCSHMVIKETKKKIQTRLVSDLSIFKEAVFSPDKEKLLLTFSIDEGNEVTREKISVLDINNLEPISLLPEEEIDLDFQWPIVDVTWTNNHTILINIPQLEDPSIESIKNWNQSNQDTRSQRSISLTLDN